MATQYKLGSHDTMTYLEPKCKWLKPFHFVARCQNVDFVKQYKLGCRMFDIRLRWDDESNDFLFAHGMMKFKGITYLQVLSYLNCQVTIDNNPIYIRMVLEYNRAPKNIDEICEKYAKLCKNLRVRFDNLTFFEYRRKYDWKQLYSYEGMPYPDIYQASSSMTWKIFDDWFPWLYAKTHNADNFKQGTSHDWLLMDFVDIR